MDDTPPDIRAYLPAIAIGIILFSAVLVAYLSAKNRTGAVVLPGGVTYLGPTPTPTPHVTADGKIPIPANAKWVERKGATYPYAFTIPDSLSLGVFPNDPYDAVTVFYPGMDANANIFFRVEDLAKLGKAEYVGKPREYVNIWWKDYTWKGVDRIVTFTNASGLTGYKAFYTDGSGKSPYPHVFFEVPGKPNLLLWLSGKLFEPEVFDRIVDSVRFAAPNNTK